MRTFFHQAVPMGFWVGFFVGFFLIVLSEPIQDVGIKTFVWVVGFSLLIGGLLLMFADTVVPKRWYEIVGAILAAIGVVLSIVYAFVLHGNMVAILLWLIAFFCVGMLLVGHWMTHRVRG